jgi:hypothetical protein
MPNGSHGERPEMPPDAPEPDVLEQSQPWEEEEETEPSPEIPPDAPEPDVLDQSRPAILDDEERERN